MVGILSYCALFHAPQSKILGPTYLFGPPPYFGAGIGKDVDVQHPLLAVENPNHPVPPIISALMQEKAIHRISIYHYVQIPFGVQATRTIYNGYVWTRAVSMANETTLPLNVFNPSNPRLLLNDKIPWSPAYCGGKVHLKTLTNITAPTAMGGFTISQADATLTVSGLPSWLTSRSVFAALGNQRPKSEYQAKVTFVKLSNGWKVQAIQVDDLYKPNELMQGYSLSNDIRF